MQLKIPGVVLNLGDNENWAIMKKRRYDPNLTLQQSAAAKKFPMQTLTRWEPFRELESFQNRLSTLLDRPLRRTHGQEDPLADWTPLADITEDEKEYLIKAELPEVKEEDVKVTLQNGVLIMTGERKFEKEEKKRKYHRFERGYGTFMRSLPEDGDGNKVKAEFKNGLLTVHVPKRGPAKPKQIEVNIA